MKLNRFYLKSLVFLALFGTNNKSLCMEQKTPDFSNDNSQDAIRLAQQIQMAKLMGNFNDGTGDLKILQKASFKERLELSMYKGIHDAMAGAIRDTASKVFQILPKTLDAFILSSLHLYHRFLTQIQPLNYDRLVIINNKLSKLITPYTQVSLGNFSKEKRAEIDANSNINNLWLPVKNRIVGEINQTIRFFEKSLIWYNPTIMNYKGSAIQKMAIKFSNSFSGQDQESINSQIGYLLSDLNQLKEIINSTKTLKEIQEKHSELKTWLAIVCQDLKYLGQLISSNGDGSQSKDGKFIETSMSSGSSGQPKNNNLSLEDLLGSSGGLN